VRAKTNVSERRACRVLGLSRSVLHYTSQRKDDGLQKRLIELAGERRRFGYRRLHILVEREGFEANHKRVHRLYRQAGLAVRKRRKRSHVAIERRPLQIPSGPNHTWSMDFVFDALANGKPIKCLTVVDDCTKESVEIGVARRINGQGVADLLEAVCRFRGYPAAIRTDQGPEFTGRALDQWANANGVKLTLIQPGKPTQNAYIESFTSTAVSAMNASTSIGSSRSSRPRRRSLNGGATTTKCDRTARCRTGHPPSSLRPFG
jgi:putative transposase